MKGFMNIFALVCAAVSGTQTELEMEAEWFIRHGLSANMRHLKRADVELQLGMETGSTVHRSKNGVLRGKSYARMHRHLFRAPLHSPPCRHIPKGPHQAEQRAECERKYDHTLLQMKGALEGKAPSPGARTITLGHD
mmetsp:Transcript_50969/g.111654  ORF Transcript_50969/g.111654 Transcript_50969/m.111654 type:complete len:137 (-) Transcript_50969:77-487(-)|eukprot:CAMPEP_0204270716 /NCGR_PEP_ID=MMETSP0468-20130131/19050_1 /ASSEMBLY_ACC=CAM_ASM_000383 /TAXON_ID=2969 /ORGANISM="Oxyrrhis marina" /LENGTH=136 /DNA_ID=CAMNT_0051246285 /DNA_START=70 /DNA_END=480 /DNA_ORIENTATION=+